MVVRKKNTGRIYAMKVLKKGELSARNEVEHAVSERKVLEGNSNNFLINLKYSFQSDTKIYLVLDYVAGGELFVHLQREGIFSEERSRFYTGKLRSVSSPLCLIVLVPRTRQKVLSKLI